MLMDRKSARAEKLYKRTMRVTPRIEVSALAAIMWTLGIVMIFATEYHHPGVTADLPMVNHAKDMPGARREDALFLMITRDGKTFFQKELVAGPELPDRIHRAWMQTDERKIYIKADARVRYRTVRLTLAQLQIAGVQDIAFLTDQPTTTR
jgi:biopolymer transport protein ExbD